MDRIQQWIEDARWMGKGFLFTLRHGFSIGEGDLPLINILEPSASRSYVTARIMNIAQNFGARVVRNERTRRRAI